MVMQVLTKLSETVANLIPLYVWEARCLVIGWLRDTSEDIHLHKYIIAYIK